MRPLLEDVVLLSPHLTFQVSWLGAACTGRVPSHLIRWPPVQAVGVELVDMQHVNGTFDAEMM